jgi:predicted pyridoxine 5'-phosphate oxidase superfamily flavin-nucleotide-binding protein
MKRSIVEQAEPEMSASEYMNDAFHEGERAIQTRVGVRERMSEIGSRIIRSYMPDQHRDFFALLPFLVAGSVDEAGQPWASVLAGPTGFITSPDPKILDVRALPLKQDPLGQSLAAGAPIGLLGLQPHTRRRNRMNGVVEHLDSHGFKVRVSQSFGNCPQYIQAREPEFVGVHDDAASELACADLLDDAAMELIRSSDTFYIATAHPAAHALAGSGRAGQERSQGVDVSHRGGKPGFVRVDGPGMLTVPDFFGNFFFNTLGNLLIEPRAGLLFIDFKTGDLLQVSVRGLIIWDGPEIGRYHGAERLLRFAVSGVRRMPRALPLRWGQAEVSPVLAHTGSWA